MVHGANHHQLIFLFPLKKNQNKTLSTLLVFIIWIRILRELSDHKYELSYSYSLEAKNNFLNHSQNRNIAEKKKKKSNESNIELRKKLCVKQGMDLTQNKNIVH